MNLTYYSFYPAVQSCVYVLLGVLFAWKLPKRNLFYLRLGLSLAVMLVAVFFTNMIDFTSSIEFTMENMSTIMNLNRASAFITYFSMEMLGFGLLWICFDTNWKMPLFYSMMAFNMRHGMYLIKQLIFSFIRDTAQQRYRYDSPFYWLVCFVAVVIALPAIVAIISICHKRPYQKISSTALIAFAVFTTILSNVLNLFQLGVWATSSTIPLMYALDIFNLIASSMMILVMFKTISSTRLAEENAHIRQMRYEEQKQYLINKENIDTINIKCHDLRHQIRELKRSGAPVSEEALTNIENAIRIYDTKVKSGNESLDIILQEKSLICNNNNIVFNCITDGQLLNFMNDVDIYSLFGNIIDNAIESCMKIKDANERIIMLKIHQVAGGVIAYEENPYSGQVRFEDGLPATSKDDVRVHGYGMKSIRLITQQYHGTMQISTKNKAFRLTLYFPDSEREKENETA